MTQSAGGTHEWTEIPFWAAFRRVKRTGFPGKELLSVYRDFGVVRKRDRDDNFNVESEDLSPYQLVRPGDLAINKMKAWQGSLGVSQYEGIVSPAYFVFEPTSANDVGFLNHLLRSREFAGLFRALSKGIRPNQWDLDPDQLHSVKLNLPPLDEQRAIADYLDQETAQIDALVDKQEEFIGLLRERRRAEILSTIDGIASNRASLRHFTRIVSGSGFPVDAQGQTGLEFPFFKVKDLKTADRSGVLVAAEDSISRETARALGAVIIPKGSLVFAKVGAALLLGRVGVLPVDGCVDNNMSALIFDSSFDPAFARNLMLTFDFKQFVQPGPVPSLNMTGLREFRVPLLPMKRQQEITVHINQQTARIDALISRTEEHIGLAKERRSALITAAVTGQFDVRTAKNGTRV